MGSRTAESVRPAGRLPVALRDELVRRAEAVLAVLDPTGGAVLALGEAVAAAPGATLSEPAASTAGPTAPCASSARVASRSGAAEPPPPVVLSLAGIATMADPATGLRRAAELLAAGGTVVAIEPYRPPGARGWLADRTAAFVRARYGVRADLPVPALVRDAGFVISSIERFTMPTRMLPLRPFVEIVARRKGSGRGPGPEPGRPEAGPR